MAIFNGTHRITQDHAKKIPRRQRQEPQALKSWLRYQPGNWMKRGQRGPMTAKTDSCLRRGLRRFWKQGAFQGPSAETSISPNQPNETKKARKNNCFRGLLIATLTGLEPATSGSTVRDSDQLSYSAISELNRSIQM